MATPTVYASNKQFVGWALETTQGTAATVTTYMPVDSFGPPEDKVTWLDDKALRGNMADLQGRVQGPIHTEFQVQGPAYLDQLPYLINNILGDQTGTGTGPTIHTFSLLNSGTGQPGSLTFAHWQGLPATNQARLYAGACLSELTISGNAESSLITYTAKGSAWMSAVSGVSLTPTFSAVVPQAAWRYGLGLGGTAVGAPNKTVRDFTVTMTRSLRVENTLQNSQNPYLIVRGPLALSGSYTATVPSDETILNYLLANTQPQFQIDGSVGAAATKYGLTLDIQNAASDTTVLKVDEEAIGYNVTFMGVANSTNAGASGGVSPIKVTVTNQTAATPY